MANRRQELLFQLLRRSMALADQTAFEATTEDWQWLYQAVRQQSLTGVIFLAVSKLPSGQQPPMELAMQWMSEAEVIRGLNELQNSEAARLTKLFSEQGRQTAILKGQANARLYPDKLSRQPGDIDIWVEGGQKSVLDLLINIGLLDEVPTTANAGKHGKATIGYHHAHLPANKNGIEVEVHYRPASGNINPLTNRRLQRWLEQEIRIKIEPTEEGFYAPSLRFALMMQLAHIQGHFLDCGVGLRHICDYYWLLKNASEEDRHEVSRQLGRVGLRHVAEALMWVLSEVLHLDPVLMICKPDSYRGELMLREIMDGGNFGQYAQRIRLGMWRRVFAGRQRRLRLMRFDFWETFWQEANYWKATIKSLPKRIRRRSISPGEADKQDAKKHGDEIL